MAHLLCGQQHEGQKQNPFFCRASHSQQPHLPTQRLQTHEKLSRCASLCCSLPCLLRNAEANRFALFRTPFLIHAPIHRCGVQATFDYTAEQQDELGLTVGQFIRIIKKEDGGWWEGEYSDNASKRGWFPDNFVAPASASEIARINGASKGAFQKSPQGSSKLFVLCRCKWLDPAICTGGSYTIAH